MIQIVQPPGRKNHPLQRYVTTPKNAINVHNVNIVAVRAFKSYCSLSHIQDLRNYVKRPLMLSVGGPAYVKAVYVHCNPT